MMQNNHINILVESVDTDKQICKRKNTNLSVPKKLKKMKKKNTFIWSINFYNDATIKFYVLILSLKNKMKKKLVGKSKSKRFTFLQRILLL